MPIKQDTYIEKYPLQYSNVMNEIQYIVFELLSEGGGVSQCCLCELDGVVCQSGGDRH